MTYSPPSAPALTSVLTFMIFSVFQSPECDYSPPSAPALTSVLTCMTFSLFENLKFDLLATLGTGFDIGLDLHDFLLALAFNFMQSVCPARQLCRE